MIKILILKNTKFEIIFGERSYLTRYLSKSAYIYIYIYIYISQYFLSMYFCSYQSLFIFIHIFIAVCYNLYLFISINQCLFIYLPFSLFLFLYLYKPKTLTQVVWWLLILATKLLLMGKGGENMKKNWCKNYVYSNMLCKLKRKEFISIMQTNIYFTVPVYLANIILWLL